MLDLEDRILLNDGISIITDELAIDILLKDGSLPESTKVLPSKSSEKYKTMFGENIEHDGNDPNIEPDITYDKDSYNDIRTLLINIIRDSTNKDTHHERVMLELDYIEEHNLQYFLLQVNDMIVKFKEDNVVWGVGRGSSCASYVLFLLGIHDVNPITYDINPSEFYKNI